MTLLMYVHAETEPTFQISYISKQFISNLMPPKEDKAVNIPWDNDMVLCLLNLVIAKGAHLHKRTMKSTELWIEVHNALFDQPEYAHLKKLVTTLDKAGRIDVRKLKDKLVSVKEAVLKKKETGNLSGLEGDMSPTFQLVQQIMQEEADVAEQALIEKQSDVDNKKRLEDNEKTVLSNQPKKRKTKELSEVTSESSASSTPSSTSNGTCPYCNC